MSHGIKTHGPKLALALGVMVLATVVTPKMKADEINKKVVMTFSGPVEIPGKVLPAGTYIFKSLPGNPSMFEVSKGDNNEPLGLFYTVRDYSVNVPSKVEVHMEERHAGSPGALRSWTYPGDPYGFEFVYPVK